MPKPLAIPGKTIDHSLPFNPSQSIQSKSGTAMACFGIRITRMAMPNRKPLPLKEYLAKTKPAAEHTTVAKNACIPENINEFKKYSTKGIV